jgi:AcrR family transcriptional regulator
VVARSAATLPSPPEVVALPPDRWPTRLRIVAEASHLFAAKGFHGTSTRDIATAVGIRQPSLFHHFASKRAIALTLLSYDLDPSIGHLEDLRAAGDPVPVLLYRYLLADAHRGIASPFDFRGLYFTDLLDEPEFAEGGGQLERWKDELAALIERGVRSGDFVEVDPRFAMTAIDALLLETLRAAGAGRRDQELPDNASGFCLRALLRDPELLPAIRAAAHEAEGLAE